MSNSPFIKTKPFRYKPILSFGYPIVHIVCRELNVDFEGYNSTIC